MESTYKQATELNFADIEVGAVYEFNRKLSGEDVLKFAELTGDFNPLHVDPEYAAKSLFGKNVVHGMLAASLVSALVGMHCPGMRSLFLSQTLKFRQPIFYNDTVTVRGTVAEKFEGIKVITLKTEVLKEGEVCINGESKIRLMDKQDD